MRRLSQKKYALSNEPVHLYVCGGDGTLHEVINGCAEKENVTISVIPIGTGNDFVKYFEGLKREDFLNLANYSDPEYMDCDLIKVNGEYSINTVSFGFDVEVARQVNALKKEYKDGRNYTLCFINIDKFKKTNRSRLSNSD